VLDEGVNKHPLQEQRESVRDWRQIGLGIMGLADMLIKCGIKYGSQESLDLCNKIGADMARCAIYKSMILAYHHGSYPKFDDRIFESGFYLNHQIEDETFNGMRNSQLLTIAPTGTISTMIGVSGGIEPIFANSYTRMTKSLHGHDEVYKIYTPIVQRYMDEHNLTEEEQLPDYFVTSSTISIDERIAMQSVWQSHIDASISSTVNLPEETTIEDVENLYMQAWKAGLKGITVYRAGCKRSAILSAETNTDEKDNDEATTSTPSTLPRGTIIECSEDLIGKKRKLTTGCGSLHVLAFFDPVDGSLQEVYFNKGSTGGCANFMTGLSRTVSLLCRAGVDIKTIKDQLDSTGSCPSYAARRATKGDTSKGSCCPMAIGNALLDMWEEMQEEIGDSEDMCVIEETVETVLPPKKVKNPCPQCGESLRYEGGCIQCPSCGWSKCD
jgi:ribonucleoside-diphosphate reductase alpha chain